MDPNTKRVVLWGICVLTGMGVLVSLFNVVRYWIWIGNTPRELETEEQAWWLTQLVINLIRLVVFVVAFATALRFYLEGA
ncbi:MAG: hypothetical protein KDA60_19070 [Planctomycetales bacterium]|nr:hypothetical protein [Planctomycetales bacterium]